MRRVLSALLLPALCLPAAAEAATLEVLVRNLRPGRGEVRVTVCTADTFLKQSCQYRGRTPASGTEATVTIPDIPPGTYAAQAFQDEDGSGRIPTTFLGLPKVGIGFSNDAPFRFGPPSFADAAVRLTAAGGRIQLRLRYFD